MDGTRFDQLVRDLLGGASRRSLLRSLSALPIVGGLASVVAEANARKGKGKGKGKAKNDGGKDDDNDVEGEKSKAKRRKKQCKKKKAQACASRCGIVTVKCKKGNGKSKKAQVDCGSCACEPDCGACFICDEASETCVVDPEQQDDPCGATGQVCQADGSCECDDDSCPAGATCQLDGTCSAICGGTGCFDGDSCEPGNTPAACGIDGETCDVCSGTAPLCIDGACLACSSLTNACPGGQVCCAPECFVGVCCTNGDCGSSANECTEHQCLCGGEAPCSGSTPDCCGNPGDCTNTQTDVDNCGFCGNVCSGGTPICEAGVCVPPCGDVCANGCEFASVQPAINAATAGDVIDICAGAFFGEITINKNLTLQGAGQGNNPANDTILLGDGAGSAVTVTAMTNAVLLGLRVSGGGGATDGGGIHIQNSGTLTLIDSTVAGNTPTGNGGGIYNEGFLNANGSTVSGNTATEGGGIYNAPASTINFNAASSVTDNEATAGPGFGGGILNVGTVVCPVGGVVTGNDPDNCVDNGGNGCGGCN
jgi:hypothetical protein